MFKPNREDNRMHRIIRGGQHRDQTRHHTIDNNILLFKTQDRIKSIPEISFLCHMHEVCTLNIQVTGVLNAFSIFRMAPNDFENIPSLTVYPFPLRFPPRIAIYRFFIVKISLTLVLLNKLRCPSHF